MTQARLIFPFPTEGRHQGIGSFSDFPLSDQEAIQKVRETMADNKAVNPKETSKTTNNKKQVSLTYTRGKTELIVFQVFLQKMILQNPSKSRRPKWKGGSIIEMVQPVNSLIIIIIKIITLCCSSGSCDDHGTHKLL